MDAKKFICSFCPVGQRSLIIVVRPDIGIWIL